MKTIDLISTITGTFALCLSLSAQAFLPLDTPVVDDMVLYDDEENTVEEMELGKILFFDTRLSINHQQSCASCHNPSKGFGDGLALGIGTKGNVLGRNTPHLYNLGWSSIFMWDGREPNLESQALGPVVSEHEMDLPLDEMEKRLNAVPKYLSLFKNVYGVDTISRTEVGRAIAAFERSIIVNNTPYDKYLAGDTQAMQPSAVRGLALFKGKGNCVRCHDGANLTDDSFHNLGSGIQDKGRSAISGDASQIGAFKTSGLRNVEFTGPYMHDGALETLADVVQYYNQGGGDQGHTDSLIVPLHLTDEEQLDIVSFMKALSQPIEISLPLVP